MSFKNICLLNSVSRTRFDSVRLNSYEMWPMASEERVSRVNTFWKSWSKALEAL